MGQMYKLVGYGLRQVLEYCREAAPVRLARAFRWEKTVPAALEQCSLEYA